VNFAVEEYSSHSHTLLFSRQQTRLTIQPGSGQRDFERMYVKCSISGVQGVLTAMVLCARWTDADCLVRIRGPFRP